MSVADENRRDRTLAELGRIDILINNPAAPVGADRVPLADLAEDVFSRVINVKVVGTFLCSQAVARHLSSRAGGQDR